MNEPQCDSLKCHHVHPHDRRRCLHHFRALRLHALDHLEGLIRAERTQLLVQQELDLPMPGMEPGGDLCPACLRTRTTQEGDQA